MISWLLTCTRCYILDQHVPIRTLDLHRMTKLAHTYLCFWLTILNDWEICNSAFCVWDYYYIENRAVWVVFSCLNVVRAHLLSVLMAIIFLSRLRLRRAITSGSTPFMENDLANVSLYAMPLSLEHFWSCWSMKYWKSSLTKCLFVYKRGKRRHQTASDQAPNKDAWAILLWMWQFHMIMWQKSLVTMVGIVVLCQ